MPIRQRLPELMDDPALPANDHRQALRGLARINHFSRASRTIWHAMRGHTNLFSDAGSTIKSFSLLDVATGSGDIPLQVARLARHNGVHIDVHVCDISEEALAASSARGEQMNIPVRTLQTDILRDGLPTPDSQFDVATCSLFLHHLSEDEVVRVLRELNRVTAIGGKVIVSDLRRCRMGTAAAYIAGRVLTRSYVVHVDAIRSARAAFDETELLGLARQAEIVKAQIQHVWPFRMLLVWTK